MNRQRLIQLAAVLGLVNLAGCSLLVDFTQCESDLDCPATAACISSICEEGGRLSITDHVVVDTTWTADKVYVLENLTMIVPPATLTIEPGTIILGRRNTGLVALAGARLVAEGTRDNPIVFTSDKPVGQRLAGDWAGIAMVGRATVNRKPFNLRIITDQYDTAVGGTDDSWDCGRLKYVRIEFGGSEVDGQKALKGLTVAGCGSKTKIEYVQTHLSDDDGIGVFGGTVDFRYIVSTRARDDAFDFDTGWRGTGQFLAIQQDLLGQEGLEIENLAEDPLAQPQTIARIYNYTMIGANKEGDRQAAVYFKNGGQGYLSHGLITGYKSTATYVEGKEAADHVGASLINVQNTLLYDVGPSGTDYFGLVDGGDDTYTGFSDYTYFENADFNNVFGNDPGLVKPFDLENPGWIPNPKYTTGREIDPPPEGFDPTAVYRGAFSPSATPWTEGWTSYPLN